ncbi:HEAT repeat domain-containing protein [Peptoclostridium acidaminophilum]|nr:HEAT repeat domain-containing protein [Peptoclostridium acidaminophilum]
MAIVMLSIYVLLALNAAIFLATIAIAIKDKVMIKKYEQACARLRPYLEAYIEDEDCLDGLLRHMAGGYNRRVVLDMLLEHARQSKSSISGKFERLGYVDEGIIHAGKSLDFNVIKQMCLMKSPKAFDVLMKGSDSEDFELKYMCYYTLSLLPLSRAQADIFVRKLVSSSILRDRIIEMIDNMDLGVERYLSLLEMQSSEIGKTVFLRALKGKPGMKDEANSHRLLQYLGDTKEVRIAAVLVLASTGSVKYFDNLIELYRQEREWEVRAAIAKSMLDYSECGADVVEALKVMTYDEAWWVRFNAVEVLAKLGVEGISALVDISLSKRDAAVSALAYGALNANQAVYYTVKEYGVENDD